MAINFVYPVPLLKGVIPKVSSGFGAPRDGGARLHEGVDIMYRGDSGYYMPGGVPALAAGAGTVKYAEWRSRGGAIRIDHGIFDTLYMHLSSLLVREGQKVKPGQPVGIIGDDPINSRDPRHLHFEIRRGSEPEDPEPVIKIWPKIENPHALGPLDLLVMGILYGGYRYLRKRT